MKTKKKYYLFSWIFLFSFSILILETVSCFFLKKDNASKCETCIIYSKGPKFGEWNKPNFSHRAKKDCQNGSCYDVQYSFLEDGRRAVGNEKKSMRHILLLGGSFLFGEGLKDEETLQFKIQKSSSAHVYNYSKRGAGPMSALFFLEKGLNIKETQGTAIYLLPSFHINRIGIGTSTFWLKDFPNYKLNSKKNDVIFTGNKIDEYPVLIKILNLFRILKNHSNFLSVMNFEINLLNKKKSAQIMAKVLKKMKTIYESKYQGEFIIAYYKIEKYLPLEKYLTESNIKYIIINDFFDRRVHRLCECDPHPNENYSDKFLSILNEKLSKEMNLTL